MRHGCALFDFKCLNVMGSAQQSRVTTARTHDSDETRTLRLGNSSQRMGIISCTLTKEEDISSLRLKRHALPKCISHSSLLFPPFPTCSLINPSTHSSTSSALCVNHSHHFSWVLVCADGALLVTLGGVGRTGTSSNTKGIVFSSPDADATMLDKESKLAGMVANTGVANGDGKEWVGGSTGVSLGVDESLWWPEGRRGSRRVPLLGEGVMWMESQIIL
jgi:hypothetical protein